MFRLAHISDPHLGPLPQLTWLDLAGKRLTGYVNWQRHRGKTMGAPVLSRLMADIQSQNPDHLVISGDLVNLGLAEEVNNARIWLDSLGDPKEVSIVPGNHDAYVPGALARACKTWAPFMQGDAQPPSAAPEDVFPYLRVRGSVAVIGVSSAIATSPFLARGAFRPSQAKKLEKMLRNCDEQKLFRIIIIHHPPVRGATAMHKRLFGIGLFQRTISAAGAELVLHGHTHVPTLSRIPGPDGKIPVAGISSASQSPGGRMPASAYNLFEISGSKGKWQCSMQHFEMSERSASSFGKSRISLHGRDAA